MKTYRKLNKIQLFGFTVVCSTDSHCPKLLSTFNFLDFHPTVIVVLYLCQLTEKFVVYILKKTYSHLTNFFASPTNHSSCHKKNYQKGLRMTAAMIKAKQSHNPRPKWSFSYFSQNRNSSFVYFAVSMPRPRGLRQKAEFGGARASPCCSA